MLGQFKVGFILLSLLFFYDIFWVFGTPVMVTVAKSLDGPIKLMFPKDIDQKDFNMIGLGDIIIPGIYVALMLRYDIIKYYKTHPSAREVPFSIRNCKYFIITINGYSAWYNKHFGIMFSSKHAQPALLYLIPGCPFSSATCCCINGDLTDLWV